MRGARLCHLTDVLVQIFDDEGSPSCDLCTVLVTRKCSGKDVSLSLFFFSPTTFHHFIDWIQLHASFLKQCFLQTLSLTLLWEYFQDCRAPTHGQQILAHASHLLVATRHLRHKHKVQEAALGPVARGNLGTAAMHWCTSTLC